MSASVLEPSDPGQGVNVVKGPAAGPIRRLRSSEPGQGVNVVKGPGRRIRVYFGGMMVGTLCGVSWVTHGFLRIMWTAWSTLLLAVWRVLLLRI